MSMGQLTNLSRTLKVSKLISNFRERETQNLKSHH